MSATPKRPVDPVCSSCSSHPFHGGACEHTFRPPSTPGGLGCEPKPMKPPHPRFPKPEPGDDRPPPSLSLCRQLIRQAERAELDAAGLGAVMDEAQVASDRARREYNRARDHAEQAWSLVQLALRAHARKEPMPTEAEVKAAVAYNRDNEGIALPDGAKEGDTIRNPQTGERVKLIKGPDGSLYGLPLEGGGA